jgi:hypothetical protein
MGPPGGPTPIPSIGPTAAGPGPMAGPPGGGFAPRGGAPGPRSAPVPRALYPDDGRSSAMH